jgi:uncharacterized membrane protein
MITGKITFFVNRLREKLWVRPLFFCLLSVAGAFLAKIADAIGLGEVVPEINPDSIEKLLEVIASSMLVISTFAVGSMISAYSAASSTATPRSFALVLSDDVSQNALSAFIGAFIYSIVAIITMENDYFGKAGYFALFVLTILVFALVILTFIRWVEQIARLGRLGPTIDKIEWATTSAMERRRKSPRLHGCPVEVRNEKEQPIYSDEIGYVQHIHVSDLQAYAEEKDMKVVVAALTGAFTAPGRPIAHIYRPEGELLEKEITSITENFIIGRNRVFDEDPRFGLIALSEIASRALSPGINDPGTAIAIIGAFIRLFTLWTKPLKEEEMEEIKFNRIEVPELSIWDMFEDAFTPIARDGAGIIEVEVRLQKAFASFTTSPHPILKEAAFKHAHLAKVRFEHTLNMPQDLAVLEEVSLFLNEK